MFDKNALNAFQQDAYCLLVARISQHALLPGGVYLPSGVVYLPQGVYLLGGTCMEGGVPAKGGVPAQVLSPPNRMTDRCKNITLPQTSFAGGKNITKHMQFFSFRHCSDRNEALKYTTGPMLDIVVENIRNTSEKDHG